MPYYPISTALLFLLSAAAAAALLFAWQKQRAARRTMERLGQMLDEALRGSFVQEHYDETRLSQTETRLARHLAASSLSAQALAADKAKLEELVTDISHQTKTPLANILLYSQLLAEQPLSPEGQKCLEALAAQTTKLQSLIEALVKTSRLETGILALQPRLSPRAPLLAAAAGQFAPKAAAKQISLAAAPLPQDNAAGYTALCDPQWTAEAICNLLDNAVKYTPAGGAVTLELAEYELFCRLTVADTGPGVSPAEQAKIFRRFYRSPGSARTEGVGVGLYLARQIAQAQGGYIKVAANPGGGARFSLYLPRG